MNHYAEGVNQRGETMPHLGTQRCRVFINGKSNKVRSSTQLKNAVENARTAQFVEVMLVVGDLPEHNFTMMLNGDVAALFYSENIDEHSFTSRNPAVSAGCDAEVEFLLSNGQKDLYPASWVVPATTAVDAICAFYKQHELSGNVTWRQEF